MFCIEKDIIKYSEAGLRSLMYRWSEPLPLAIALAQVPLGISRPPGYDFLWHWRWLRRWLELRPHPSSTDRVKPRELRT